MPVYVEIVGPMYEGKAAKDDKRQPPTLAEVIDLETGENAVIVCPEVVKSTLNESFPNEGYIGKQFSIEKLAQDNPEKKYFPYRISEIEVSL